ISDLHDDCDGSQIGEDFQSDAGKIESMSVYAVAALDRPVPGFRNWTAAEDDRETTCDLISRRYDDQ
ncbi:hypothetical protein KEM54_004936, partial [Ascosphaera aggregata]